MTQENTLTLTEVIEILEVLEKEHLENSKTLSNAAVRSIFSVSNNYIDKLGDTKVVFFYMEGNQENATALKTRIESAYDWNNKNYPVYIRISNGLIAPVTRELLNNLFLNEGTGFTFNTIVNVGKF